jgi:hypothetical protein
MKAAVSVSKAAARIGHSQAARSSRWCATPASSSSRASSR